MIFRKQRFKEEVISIVLTLLFVLGFFVLINNDVSYTGYAVDGVVDSLQSEITIDSVINTLTDSGESLQHGTSSTDSVSTDSDTFTFEPEAVYYGTDASSFFGSPLAPTNRSRIMDDRSIDFVFNSSAEGIHNLSKIGDYCVGNWWFEQNSTDASGNGNDGTINGDVKNTTGIVGYGYHFDGWLPWDSVQVPHDPSLNPGDNEISIMMWVKPSELIGNKFFLGKGSYITGTYSILRGGGTYQCYFNGTLSSGGSAVVNEWQHVACVYNGSNSFIYVDGILKDSDYTKNTNNLTLNLNDEDLYIGSAGGGHTAWNGSIDEVLIFNRTLTSGEISQIYNDTLSGGTSTVENCSLLLNIDDGNYEVNKTLSGVVFHNQSNISSYAVGNWRFEQDSAKNYADPTYNNGTLVDFDGDENVSGIVGYGYSFDNADRIWFYGGDIGGDETLNITGNITVMAWVNKPDAEVFEIRKGSPNGDGKGYHIQFHSNGNAYWEVCPPSTGRILTAASEDQWTHITGTYNETDMVLYINGMEEARKSSAYNCLNATTTDLFIGDGGIVDEVLIFNRTLTSGEISQIYNDTWGETYRKLNFEGYNTTIDVDFGFNQHDIDWKIQCYDSLHVPYNSSEMTFELDALVTQSKPNIGAHAYYDPNYVVGSWRFEEFNTTTFKDETGINNGTISGGVKWCPDGGDSQKWNCSGRVGKGVHFDGVGDRITVSGSGLDLAIWTLSAWIKPTSCANYDQIIGSSTSNQYNFFLQAGCTVAVWQTGGGANAGAVSLNEWTHVAATWDGTTITVYKNAVAGTSVERGAQPSGSTSLGIGSTATGGNYFNGAIDEVTIWNRSLSALEMKQLYYSSAVSYNSTFTIQDISASNNLTEDEDNDTIKFIYDWYVNNESMAVLNMPFEAVNNGSEMNYSKDYSDRENHATATSFNGQSFSCESSSTTTTCSGWNRTGGYDGFGAYSFDGDGDFIQSDLSSVTLWNYSISFWVNYQLGDTYKTILDGNDFFITISGDCLRIADGYTGNATSCGYSGSTGLTNLPTGEWHFITINHLDNKNISFYDNGVFNSSCLGNDVSSTLDATSRFGHRRASAGQDFNGTLDEFMIWNRSLSAEQIKALYYNQTQTIKSQETVKGQSWKAEVTANDGYGDSIEYNTSEIIIDDVTLDIHNVYPKNLSILYNNIVNFTYNVSDGGSVAGVQNCSLYLGTTSSNLQLNYTNNLVDGTAINQTFNVTFPVNKTHEYHWLIACYDKDEEQTNSSEGIFSFERTVKPAILTATIQPSIMAYTNQTLIGNCSASDSEGDNITYYWRWYNNDALNSSGDTGTNYTQNTQVNVNNTNSINTTIGDEWIFSCRGNDGVDNTSWLNSSVTIISQPNIKTEGLHSFRVDEFVTVSGNKFMLGGSEYVFRGTDSYYLADYATNHTYDDDGNEITNSKQYVTEILNEAQYLDVNVIRTWAGMQGGGRGNSSWGFERKGGHYNLFENDEPGNFNETMFKALDWVIYEASKRDIRLLLVLVNNWNDYGGMRWYAQQSPTTVKTFENVTNNGFDNWSLFHDQFYDDLNCITWFKNYTNYTLHRNNTYSGLLYKDDPAIFAWMLVNEPRAKSDSTDKGGDGSLLVNWTKNMSAFIKSEDPNHLVGLGIEGWGTPYEGTEFIDDHNISDIDFSTYALHPDRWDWFARRSENSTGDLVREGVGANSTIDWWTNETGVSWNIQDVANPAYSPAYLEGGYYDWVRQHTNWSNFTLEMPVILQECGVYTEHKIPLKDRYYEQVIDNFYTTGGDGLLFWTFNHDNYYYSTAVDGDMDDGFGYYLSDNAFLKNKSVSVIDAYDYAKSYTRELNFHKYDFIVNAYPQGKHDQSNISSYAVGNWRFEQDSAKNYADPTVNNGTLSGNVNNVTGVVGYAYEFEGTNDWITTSNVVTDLNRTNLTVLFWMKVADEDLWGGNPISQWGSNKGFRFYVYMRGSYDSIYFGVGNGTDTIAIHTPNGVGSIVVNEWIHVAGVYRDDTQWGYIYTNGVLRNNPYYKVSHMEVANSPLKIGGLSGSGSFEFNGSIDEVLVFNRSLSQTEIENIYMTQKYGQPSVERVTNVSLFLNIDSAGYNLDQTNTSLVTKGEDYTLTKQFSSSAEEFWWKTQWCDDHDHCYNSSEGYVLLGTAPLITEEYPANDTYYNGGGTKEFNYSVADTLDISNCQLYVDNVLNKTETVVTRDVTQSFSVAGFSSVSAIHTWNITCTDIGDNVGYSENRILTIDTIYPAVTLQAPINNTNSSSSYVNFTYNVSDNISPIDACTLWLWKNNAWELNHTDKTITKDINQTINITFEETSVKWRVECNDSANNRQNSTTYNITIDITAPTVQNQAPVNDTIFSCRRSQVSITYNASDSPSNIQNCSLYVRYDSSDVNEINSTDAGIEEGINQTFNITFRNNNDTWVYWKVGCYNDALLHKNSSIRRFKVDTYCPVRVSQPHPGSSSGMGSSGERQASTITESVQTVGGNVYSIDKLLPGETELDMSDPGLSIVKIYLDSSKEADNVEFKVEELRNVKLEKPDRRVYRYINIETELPESFINKVRIIFKLHKGWGQDIKLLRYTSSWMELETNKIDTDEYYDYYEAVSPGFSYFAISGKKISVILKEEVEKIAQEIVEKPSKLELWIYALIPIIVLVLVSLVLLYYLVKLVRKHKKITLSAALLGLGIIALVTPFTSEVLYWAILPLSVIVLVLGGIGFVVWKFIIKKQKKKVRRKRR